MGAKCCCLYKVLAWLRWTKKKEKKKNMMGIIEFSLYTPLLHLFFLFILPWFIGHESEYEKGRSSSSRTESIKMLIYSLHSPIYGAAYLIVTIFQSFSSYTTHDDSNSVIMLLNKGIKSLWYKSWIFYFEIKKKRKKWNKTHFEHFSKFRLLLLLLSVWYPIHCHNSASLYLLFLWSEVFI